MKEKKAIFTVIGFIAGITALTTIMIPLLSLILVIIGIIFSILGKGGEYKAMTYASIGMCVIAFLLDMLYLYIVMIGKA